MHEDKTPEKIKSDILDALDSDLEKLEGGFADDMAGPLAVEASKVYQSLNAVHPMVWVNETSGVYLDYAAEDLGIPARKKGTKAQVDVEVTGTAGYTVPAGTIVLDADNLGFVTPRDTKLDDNGTALIFAEAQEVGTKYNVTAGSIKYRFNADSRIGGIRNPEPAMGGSDPESDISLFKRIQYARRRPATSGNVYHYEMWALESPGVGVVRVYPRTPVRGWVKVLIADENSQPVDELIVAGCFDHIEEMRPVGANVNVLSAVGLPVNVTADVKLRPNADTEAIEQDFREAVTAHFKAISLQSDKVLCNRIGAILIDIRGVQDYSGLLLNSEGDNIILAAEEVPVLGEVAFKWI